MRLLQLTENYDKLKKEADELTVEINEFRNKIFYTSKKLKIKELNFKSSENTNVDIERIEKLFNEANFFFEEKITKRLEQSQEFHNNLINNRKKRLSIEIEDLRSIVDKLENDICQASKKRDSISKLIE